MEKLTIEVNEAEKLREKVEMLNKELSEKDGQISELLAEMGVMKEKLKQMGVDMYTCQSS